MNPIATIPIAPTELSTTERAELGRYEAVIKRGLETFVAVGNALLYIRRDRLYRGTHSTFEAYCEQRWQMTDNYANKLIGAAEVVGNLGTIVPVLPATESQARPLTKLDPEEQREVWQEVVATAQGGKVTAAHVQRVVDAQKPPVATNAEWTQSELSRRGEVEQGKTVLANMHHDHALIAWAADVGLYERIVRGTIWGNPFVEGEDGDRQTVIENYQWFLERKPSLLAKVNSLQGKVLGCWCYPEDCHGQILIARGA